MRIFAFLLCAAGILTGSAGASADLLGELAEHLTTPEEVAQFLCEEFAFQKDTALFSRSDYWQEPQEFLIRGEGDCEDYALLAQAIFTRQGKEAYLLSLFGREGYSHTVCVFRQEGRYRVINQDRLLTPQAMTLKEAATLVFPDWRWGGLSVQAGTRGRLIAEIRNPSP